MSKLFKYAGVSRRNGTFKARFANDQMRVKVLAKTGSSDIDMIELKEPMTKEDAIAFLISIDFDNGNAEVRAALEDGLARRTDKPAKAERAPKAAKVPKSKTAPTMEGIKAKVAAKKSVPKSTVTRAEVKAQMDAEFEDAPF